MADAPSTDSSALWGAAKLIGRECSTVNKNFYKCKKSDRDPAACLEHGAAATECGLNVLRTLNASCAAPFAAYRKCLDSSVYNLNQFETCRTQQLALQKCYDSANASSSAASA